MPWYFRCISGAEGPLRGLRLHRPVALDILFNALMDGAGAVVDGGSLVTKVLFPLQVLPAVKVLAQFVNYLLTLPIMVVFLLAEGIKPHLTCLAFPLVALSQLAITFALALFLTTCTVFMRDTRHILGNLITLWFFLTPVLYPVDQVPAAYRFLVGFNPAATHIRAYQDIFFYGRWPDFTALGLVSLWPWPCSCGRAGLRQPQGIFRREDMKSQPVIEVRGLVKAFRRELLRSDYTTWKSLLLKPFQTRRGHDLVTVLNGIDLTVDKGRTLALIGQNGSGKSTLLKILAGIYKPDRGEVAVRGRVASLIELGAGFHPEFTGRENVYLTAPSWAWQAGDRRALRQDRGLLRPGRLHRRAGAHLQLGHVRAPGLLGGGQRGPRRAPGGRGAGGGRRGLRPQVRGQDQRVQAHRQDHLPGHPRPGGGGEVRRRGGLAGRRLPDRPRRAQAGDRRLPPEGGRPGGRHPQAGMPGRGGPGGGRGHPLGRRPGGGGRRSGSWTRPAGPGESSRAGSRSSWSSITK